MIRVPKDYITPIIRILEWHLEFYVTEVIFDTRIKRILDKLYKASPDCHTYIEKNEIYYIYECVSDATNNIQACNIEKDLVWDIHSWAFAEYKQVK